MLILCSNPSVAFLSLTELGALGLGLHGLPHLGCQLVSLAPKL